MVQRNVFHDCFNEPFNEFRVMSESRLAPSLQALSENGTQEYSDSMDISPKAKVLFEQNHTLIMGKLPTERDKKLIQGVERERV